MVENEENNVVENKNTNGLTIASLVLGIISLVLWCMWFLSIPCAILALIFGILGLKKPGKGMAIAGVITSAIALAIWILLFVGAFMYGFIEGVDQSTSREYYSSSYYWD